MVNATSTLERTYKSKGHSKELELINKMTSLWMKSKMELVNFKYQELEALGVPKEIAEKWKRATRIETELKAEEVSEDELLKRIDMSLGEFDKKRQGELKEAYEEIGKAVKDNDPKVQEKVQKLQKRIKEEKMCAQLEG